MHTMVALDFLLLVTILQGSAEDMALERWGRGGLSRAATVSAPRHRRSHRAPRSSPRASTSASARSDRWEAAPVLQSVLSEKRSLALASFSLLASAAIAVSLPAISGQLSQAVATGSSPLGTRTAFALLTFGYVAEVLLTKVWVSSASALVETYMSSLRMSLFNALLVRDFGFFDKESSANELEALISSDCETVRSRLLQNLARDRGPRALLECSFACIILVVIAKSFGVAVFCSVALLAYVATQFQRFVMQLQSNDRNAVKELSQLSFSTFAAMRTVRSCHGEPQASSAFREKLNDAFQTGRRLGSANGSKESLNRSCIYIALLLVFGCGFRLVRGGVLPPSAYFASIGFVFVLLFSCQVRI